MERHTVRRHGARVAAATEVGRGILHATTEKLSKNYVFEERQGHAAQNELTRHATRQNLRTKLLPFFMFGATFAQKGIWYGNICCAAQLPLKWRA